MVDLQQIACPECGKKGTWDTTNPFRPFCSERCKLIDLGQWASESYSIKSEDKAIPEEDDSAEDT